MESDSHSEHSGSPEVGNAGQLPPRADLQGLHDDLMDADSDSDSASKLKRRDSKGKGREIRIPLAAGLAPALDTRLGQEQGAAPPDFTIELADATWHHLRAFEGFEDAYKAFVDEPTKTALVQALERVQLLHKQDTNKASMIPHIFQEFVVFTYAYVPFGIALITSWLCYNYKGMSEADAKMLAGFMGGFGDCLNAKILHSCFRFNNTNPSSWSRDKVEEQILLARGKIANAVAKALGVPADLELQAKAFPLGKWEFVLNELAAYISDGLSMIFFAVYLVLGAPLTMGVAQLVFSLMIGALLSGIGVGIMMVLRMITECIAHQPPLQTLDMDGDFRALQDAYGDVIQQLKDALEQATLYDAPKAPFAAIEKVIADYEARLVELNEKLGLRKPAKPTTIAERLSLFTKDGPLAVSQVIGHTFGFMVWPIMAYSFHTESVTAALIGCGLGIACRQEWAYPFVLMSGLAQGVYRGAHQWYMKTDANQEHNTHGHDIVVTLPELPPSSSSGHGDITGGSHAFIPDST